MKSISIYDIIEILKLKTYDDIALKFEFMSSCLEQKNEFWKKMLSERQVQETTCNLLINKKFESSFTFQWSKYRDSNQEEIIVIDNILIKSENLVQILEKEEENELLSLINENENIKVFQSNAGINFMFFYSKPKLETLAYRSNKFKI